MLLLLCGYIEIILHLWTFALTLTLVLKIYVLIYRRSVLKETLVIVTGDSQQHRTGCHLACHVLFQRRACWNNFCLIRKDKNLNHFIMMCGRLLKEHKCRDVVHSGGIRSGLQTHRVQWEFHQLAINSNPIPFWKPASIMYNRIQRTLLGVGETGE